MVRQETQKFVKVRKGGSQYKVAQIEKSALISSLIETINSKTYFNGGVCH